MRPNHSTHRPPSSQRGVALLAAMCFSLVLAIALGSYITVCYRTLQMSTRNMNAAHSVELAETGMEDALWALNNNNWSDWTVVGHTATKTLAGFIYDNGATGTIVAAIANYDGSTVSSPRTITVTGITTLSDGTTISRTLTSSSRKAPLFVNALAATTGRIRFKGTGTVSATVDSYDSSTDPTAAATGYDASVISMATTTNQATVQMLNAQIRGFVATTTVAPIPSYSTSAKLIGSATPVPLAYQAPTNASVDLRRFSTTAYQPLFDENPSTGAATALPSGSVTIGTAGATTPARYSSGSISLTGSQVLTVNGPVILTITGNLTVSSSAKILITSTGSLEVHLSGDLTLGGAGVENLTQKPKNFILIAKADNFYDSLAFSATTPLYGVIYTPNNSITFSNSVTIFGSIVAKSITFNNLATIHYDKDLVNTVFSGINTPYAVSNWREVATP